MINCLLLLLSCVNDFVRFARGFAYSGLSCFTILSRKMCIIFLHILGLNARCWQSLTGTGRLVFPGTYIHNSTWLFRRSAILSVAFLVFLQRTRHPQATYSGTLVYGFCHPPLCWLSLLLACRRSTGAGHQHRPSHPSPYPGVPGRQRRVKHPRLHHGLPVARTHGFAELASRANTTAFSLSDPLPG